tara:strand:- start:980 stop:1177 length:198 start_codon:yes stop_codon:yes gene_type:complete
MSELIGSAAGVVWKYLDLNGASSVAKIAKDSALEIKVLQRAIGWLANENKLNIEMKGRTETISLK